MNKTRHYYPGDYKRGRDKEIRDIGILIIILIISAIPALLINKYY